MGLFNLFNKRNEKSNFNSLTTNPISQEIPESVFIEKENYTPLENNLQTETKTTSQPHQTNSGNESGINILFNLLEKNHESKGYEDALINPDTSHLEQNIEALKNELQRTIHKVKIFYEDFIREIDFHIETRSRSGMVDTVEELTVKRKTAESHINQIKEIEQDSLENKGASQGIIISYTRGFKNGLAAISHMSIMKKNF